MADRISERELILPALFCIDNAQQISTTELSDCLRELLKPSGEDVEILSNRLDDKFSQKVRNLRSHKTLERYGLATYERQGTQGYWKITAYGKQYLEANQPLLIYLDEQKFDYNIQQEALSKVAEPTRAKLKQLVVFDEGILEKDIAISEGKNRIVKQTAYERSAKLRELAIRFYAVDGAIQCEVCGFDFRAVYGSHGEGFIEIHHIKPIFHYADQDMEKTLASALQNVVPLCSNCHRMIHRKRSQMLSVAELKQIIHNSKTSE